MKQNYLRYKQKIANVKKLKYPLHTCIMVKDSNEKFIDMQTSHQTDFFLKSVIYFFKTLTLHYGGTFKRKLEGMTDP